MCDESKTTFQKASEGSSNSKPSTTGERRKPFRKLCQGLSRAFKKENYRTGNCKSEYENYEFNPEKLFNLEREGMDRKSLRNKKIDWPKQCFEHLVVIGLPHTVNARVAVERILKEKALKKHGSQNLLSSTSQSKKASHHCPLKPSFAPELLYKFPEDKELQICPEDLASFCFPHGITPRLLRRTPSMSALNEVVYGPQHSVHSDQSFVIMLKGADDLPMFAVCYLVNQMLNSATVAASESIKHKAKETKVSCENHLVAAPRCYCLLSRYPFFKLHFQVLNLLLGLERLNSISKFMNEIVSMPSSDSTLFSRLNSRNSSRLNSMTPDSTQICAYSASPIPPASDIYLERQSFSRSEIVCKDYEDQEYHAIYLSQGAISVNDNQIPRISELTPPRHSFSGVPGLLHSFSSAPINSNTPVTANTANALPNSARQVSRRNSESVTRDQVQSLNATMVSTATATATAAAISTSNVAANSVASSSTCGSSCCSSSDDTSPPSRDCCFLNKLEIEKNPSQQQLQQQQHQNRVPSSILRSSHWQGSPIPPRYPEPDQQHHHKGIKQGGQELMDGSLPPSNSQQLNNARSQGLDYSDQDTKSTSGYYGCSHSRSVSGQSLRDCYDTIDTASNVLGSCFIPPTHGFVESCSYQTTTTTIASDFRPCSSTPTPGSHKYTQSGDSDMFFTSSSMPTLLSSQGGGSGACDEGNYGQEKTSRVAIPSSSSEYLSYQNTVSLYKSPSVGEMCKLSKNNQNSLWPENDVFQIMPACYRLLCHFRDLKVPKPGETIVFNPEEDGVQEIKFTRLEIGKEEIYLEECKKDQDLHHHHHHHHHQHEHEHESTDELTLCPDLIRIQMETCLGLRPWSVAVLCRTLSLDNILSLLAGVLLEKQIVFFCSNIGVLTSSVLSLLPLIHPFYWHCFILPLLPSKQADLLYAPIPYLVGVQHKTSDIVQRCKSVIRVNLYKDKVKNAPLVSSLPGYKTLHSKLTHWHKQLQECGRYSQRPSHVVTSKEEHAVESFLGVLRGHLTGFVSDLRRHTIKEVTTKEELSVFWEESFIDAFPEKDQSFMQEFTQTQMFDSYLDSVL